MRRRDLLVALASTSILLLVSGASGAQTTKLVPPGQLTWFAIHPDVKMQAGAVVTAMQPFLGHVDLFATDVTGKVWSTFFETSGGWRPWFAIHPEVKMQPGATVTAMKPFDGHVDLYVTGKDGAVWSTFFDNGKGWRAWFPIHPEVKMRPGATVTAKQPFDGHVDLYVTGNDGAVWSTFFDSKGGWRPWFAIHPEIRMQPGTTVTAAQPFAGHIDLYATGIDGTVWSTFFEAKGGGWRPWFTIHREHTMKAGATLTVLADNLGSTTLYAVNSQGTLCTTAFTAEQGWKAWSTIRPELKLKPGATPIRPNIVTGRTLAEESVFAVGSDGSIWVSTAWPGWGPWVNMNAGRLIDPRGAPTVQTLDDSSGDKHATHTNIYATGTDGTVWSTFWRDADATKSGSKDGTSFFSPRDLNGS